MVVVPLEKRVSDFINWDTRKRESRSVLDACHKVNGKFTTYKSLPSSPKSASNNASYEECLARLKCMHTDFSWLLRLSYERFWCQAIHDERLHQCLDTFLRYAPRSFDANENVSCDDEISAIFPDVSRKVFLTCLRMSTYKESKDNYMSKNVFGDVIYENFLFNVPMLIDLCVIYGRSNGAILRKMVANVFQTQPKYNEDLHATIDSIVQVFDTISAQCNVTDDHGQLPPKLEYAKMTSLANQTDKMICDLVDYIFDVSTSLWSFLEVYSPAAEILHQQNLHTKISWFYSNVIPVLKTAIAERDFYVIGEDRCEKAQVSKRLNQSRIVLIKLVRQILYNTCLLPILENCSTNDVGLHVETFLQSLTNMLSDKCFIYDYEAKFKLSSDLEIIGQTSYKLDATRTDYVRAGMAEAASDKPKRPRKGRQPDSLKFRGPTGIGREKKCVKWSSDVITVTDKASAGAYSYSEHIGSDYSDVGGARNSGEDEDLGACAPAVTGIELDSLISSVRDILPDLGDGFIERCLVEYNFSPSDVVDAVLTGYLRAGVRDLDRSLRRAAPADQAPADQAQAALFPQRKSVFDNDEFDVFNREDIDLTRVHRGKKFMGDEGMSMLDHRPELSKEMFEKFSVIDQEGDAYDFKRDVYESALYDDEYDDTYDTADVGAMLDADEIEDFKTQPLNVKKGPRQFSNPADDEDDDDEEEVEKEARRRDWKRDPFVMDPAVLREKQAQYRATQQQKRAPAPKHDVVGRAKGQGQEKSVLKNRTFKDQNKARLANHNRRSMADKKRSKGMFPA